MMFLRENRWYLHWILKSRKTFKSHPPSNNQHFMLTIFSSLSDFTIGARLHNCISFWCCVICSYWLLLLLLLLLILSLLVLLLLCSAWYYFEHKNFFDRMRDDPYVWLIIIIIHWHKFDLEYYAYAFTILTMYTFWIVSRILNAINPNV